MKKYLLFILMSGMIFSCQKEESIKKEIVQEQTQERWCWLFSKKFKISGNAMHPTLREKETICVEKAKNNLMAWDIILFEQAPNPNIDKKYMHIMRIVWVPNDELEIKKWRLFINWNPAKEEYFRNYIPENIKENISLITLWKDEYYVLWDNRDASTDSRIYWPIKQENILWKYIWKY